MPYNAYLAILLPTDAKCAQPLSSEEFSTALLNKLTNFESCFHAAALKTEMY
jgi:hypothetical protein